MIIHLPANTAFCFLTFTGNYKVNTLGKSKLKKKKNDKIAENINPYTYTIL